MIPSALPFDRLIAHRHCPYCLLKDEDVKVMGVAAWVFLDMDEVMIVRSRHVMNSKIDQTLKQMFGAKEYYTALERREASSVHLFPQVVGSLMHLIHRTEAQGKRVGIVISSSWGHDGKTEDLLQMFASQPFGSYIIGRTPSHHFFDPLRIKFEEDQRLTDRGNEIQAWLRFHPAVEQYVSFDDESMERDSGNLTAIGRHWVQVEDNCLTDEHIRHGLEILRVNAFHCNKCSYYPEETTVQNGKRTILLIQDPLQHDSNPHEDRVLEYLITRLQNAGLDVGCVVTASHYTNKNILPAIKKLWVGRLDKRRPFNEEADSWVAAHEIKYSLKIETGQLAECLQAEQVSQWVWNTGFFKRISGNRHCRFCTFTHDEVHRFKKISWIFMDLGGVFYPATYTPPFPSILSLSLKEDSVDQFTKMIARIPREVGIVITSPESRVYTTEEVCSELLTNQPFGKFLKGRTSYQRKDDPEYQFAKQSGLRHKMEWQASPLSSAIYQWRQEHDVLTESAYVILTSEETKIYCSNVVKIKDCTIRDADMMKAESYLCASLS